MALPASLMSTIYPSILATVPQATQALAVKNLHVAAALVRECAWREYAGQIPRYGQVYISQLRYAPNREKGFESIAISADSTTPCFPINPASLAGTAFQKERSTLAYVPRIEQDPTASIFSRKAGKTAVMAAVTTTLFAFPVNVHVGKDTGVTERSVDQKPRTVTQTRVKMVEPAVKRRTWIHISLTGGASVQRDTADDTVTSTTHVPISNATMEESVNPPIMNHVAVVKAPYEGTTCLLDNSCLPKNGENRDPCKNGGKWQYWKPPDKQYSRSLVYKCFGYSIRSRVIVVISMLERFSLSFSFFFLLCVAEKSYRERLPLCQIIWLANVVKEISQSGTSSLPSSQSAEYKDLAFTEISVKGEVPQRSVDMIVSSSFILGMILVILMCVQLIKGNEKERFLSILFNWEVSIWCLVLSVYVLRFMTLGSKINRNSQIHQDCSQNRSIFTCRWKKPPHKKEDLTIAKPCTQAGFETS
ncbi:homeodomain transcription factor [Desmophyllum pertusum]|uniref:Homeodomain transcription factor n=1 Tax=Desmophyllum pertusum TaxID=174260 RepID=A0A9X0CMS3_9CNID|nr:homeodomain transcription factor [Desmophyllum pertusum]